MGEGATINEYENEYTNETWQGGITSRKTLAMTEGWGICCQYPAGSGLIPGGMGHGFTRMNTDKERSGGEIDEGAKATKRHYIKKGRHAGLPLREVGWGKVIFIFSRRKVYGELRCVSAHIDDGRGAAAENAMKWHKITPRSRRFRVYNHDKSSARIYR